MQNRTLVRRVSRVLARNIIARRASLGLSVSQFKELTGVSRRTIDRLEAGIAIPYNPSIGTLTKIANALDTTVDSLVGVTA